MHRQWVDVSMWSSWPTVRIHAIVVQSSVPAATKAGMETGME